MQRQPRLRPSELDVDQARLYAAITGGPRARGPQAFSLVDDDGALRGPFGGFLLSPSLGDAVQRLGAAVRYESGLEDRLREMAILVVAQRQACTFERDAHEAVGRAAGLTEDELAAIREGEVPTLADPIESAGVRLASALADGDVDDALWNELVPPLDLRTAFELVALVGYYSMLALQMRVLRVD